MKEVYLMKNNSPVQSIDRVFDILETLSTSTHGMTLTELSTEVGLHTSTTHRLLSCLIAREYVQKDMATSKYRLTLRLFEIGNRAISGMNLLSIALPHIEHLADFTKETIHLVARRGNDVVYLYKEETNNSIVRIASFVGLHNPMYCTAVGKSILGYLPHNEIKKIWDETNIIQFTPNTIVNFDDLLKDLEQIRTNGYAIDREEHELGVTCVAAPIFNYTGLPVAALSISFPSSRVSNDQRLVFAEKVISSAKSITSTLGGTTNF